MLLVSMLTSMAHCASGLRQCSRALMSLQLARQQARARPHVDEYCESATSISGNRFIRQTMLQLWGESSFASCCVWKLQQHLVAA